MNINPHNQGIANVLRAEIEAWRRAGSRSREAVAAMVMDMHAVLGGEAVTGVDFSFVGDTYTQAKKGAQKLFRWLDEGNLPANMIPAIIAALPPEQRIRCLSQIFCPMGIEVRAVDNTAHVGLDVVAHLRSVMKETSEAQLALVSLPADASDAQLLAAEKELVEAAQACESAASDIIATVAAHQAVSRVSTPASR